MTTEKNYKYICLSISFMIKHRLKLLSMSFMIRHRLKILRPKVFCRFDNVKTHQIGKSNDVVKGSAPMWCYTNG